MVTGPVLAAVLPAVFAASAMIPVAGATGPPVKLARHVFVKVDLIGIRPGGTETLGSGSIEVTPGRPGDHRFPLDFYAGSGKTLSSLEVSVSAEPQGDERFLLEMATTVRLTSRLGGPVALNRNRNVDLGQGTSFLHLAYESDDRSISVVAAMSVESREVPELVVPSGRTPIIFHVFLLQDSQKGPVPLEEKALQTFEGSPVTYARRVASHSIAGTGEPAEHSDDLELTLLPTRSTGDILMVEATLSSGAGGDAKQRRDRPILSRRSHAVSRGGSIEIPFGETAGQAFSGFRFLVRPEY